MKGREIKTKIPDVLQGLSWLFFVLNWRFLKNHTQGEQTTYYLPLPCHSFDPFSTLTKSFVNPWSFLIIHYSSFSCPAHSWNSSVLNQNGELHSFITFPLVCFLDVFGFSVFSDHIPFSTPFLALFACLVLIHRPPIKIDHLISSDRSAYSPLFFIAGQGHLKTLTI